MSKDNIIEDKKQREVVFDLDQNYSAIVKRQFKKNRAAVLSLKLLIFIIIIGLLAPLIANDTPLYIKYQGNTYFPAFREVAVDLGITKWQPEMRKIINWKEVKYESVVWPLIPYSEIETDEANIHYKSPLYPVVSPDEIPTDLDAEELKKWKKDKQIVASLRWKHWMGTDESGRDLFSGIINGTTIAVKVGVVTMAIATFIGLIIGSLAGFYGDDGLKLTKIRLFLNILFIPFALFYAIKIGWFGIIVFFVIMIIPNLISNPLEKLKYFSKKGNFPLDLLLMRFIEIFNSIPRLLLILSIVAVTKQSIMLLMVIMGFTGWTGIARFTRAELLRVRNLEYMEAAKSLGFSEFRSIFRHALPNSLAPVLVSVAFGVASAILMEAGLSFIGLGAEPGVATWGKLLTMARGYPPAWWLAIFPGFAIFVTVTIYNLIGEGLTDALDPKMKQ